MLIAPTLVLAALPLASVHAEHARVQPRPAEPGARRVVEPPAQVGEYTAWVYGYYAYWHGTVAELPWDRITHLAIFSVDVAADGTISGTEHWTDVADEALALAEPYGVRVHLAVTSFDADVLDAMLSSPAARTTAVDQLVALVEAHGGHGVSVDFEGMSGDNLGDLPLFVAELAQRVEDVSVATPAVDWAQAYDYPELAASADALFIMGYDFHWRTSDPGPVAPLFGGAPWGTYALDWSVADYLATGVPPEKLVLGLPLYGYAWPSVDTTVPGVATDAASSVLFADAKAEALRFGAQWDAPSHTPYYFPNATTQTFYDDVASLDERIGWALGEQGLGGVGFWALDYDGGDPELWDMVAGHTQIDVPEPGTSSSDGGDATSSEGTSSTGTNDSTETGAPPGDTSGAPDADNSDGTGSDAGATPTTQSGCGCASTEPRGTAIVLAWCFVVACARRSRFA